MTEEKYRTIQKIFPMDLKSSSWVETPEKIRDLGGAIFCDRRFDTVFTYHNITECYYGSVSFKTILEVKSRK